MGKTGCDADGYLNEGKFSEPMPWIGIYIAVASLACAIPMATDFISGFRRHKFWFPTKCFAINATSLTVLAVAVKLSVDLNTPMPRRVDQLSKLSSGVLICTVMGNSMPSLGTMQNTEIFMNIMALGILVVTVVVNICIQLSTGVIYLYWKEHAVIMFIMLLLLVILSFSALTVPTTKKFLEHNYNKKYEMVLKEGSDENNQKTDEKLKEDLMKFWMMAHTCSPQFVMARSVTCIASGALCLLSAVTLAEAMLRSYLMPWSFKFCKGESEYKWSTTLALVTQTIAVGVGTIAPSARWFTAVHFRCPTRGKKSRQRMFKVEWYWIQCFVEMKEYPLALRIKNQQCRKLAHHSRAKILDLCIRMQSGIVIASKVIQQISIFFMVWILFVIDCCIKFKKLNSTDSISSASGSGMQSSSRFDLSQFVLHLEGENELVKLMTKNNCDATDAWLQSARKKQPKYLTKLLEKSTVSEGLKGVKEFDCDPVPSLDSEEPPNCWALPIVTLTAIAVALPNISSCKIKHLMNGVYEGLVYVNLIEEKLDRRNDSVNIKKAASILWLEVDVHHKWLDVDLHKLSLEAKSTKEVLEALVDAAKTRFLEFKKTSMNQCLKESPSKWPNKALAANSMYRISQTILQNHESKNQHMGELLFEALTVMISDILGACLTNLRRVIFLQCLGGTIEEREESIRHAVYLLGKTERIMKLLNHAAIPNLGPEQIASIDEWCKLHKMNNSFPFNPALARSETSDHLCVAIR